MKSFARSLQASRGTLSDRLLFTGGALALLLVATTLINDSSSAARVKSAPGQSDSTLIPAAGPLTLVVKTLGDAADTNVGDGVCDTDAGTPGEQCTLRAAIQETNAATTGTDVINFNLPASSTITLNTALPDINGNLIINGPVVNTLTVRRSTVIGTPNFRILTIVAGQTVTISGLTITNGRVADYAGERFPVDLNGGGISNSGTLTLNRMIISGNRAGSGTSTDVIFDVPPRDAGGGGGIYNKGVLTLINSTVSDNQAGNGPSASGGPGGAGGGIANTFDGTLILTNSTVSNNQTGEGGHACFIDFDCGRYGGFGGGILNAGTLTVTNSTLSDNHAGNGSPFTVPRAGGPGGGIANVFRGGPITIGNSTISNNGTANSGRGGGIYEGAGGDLIFYGGAYGVGGEIKLKNTIIANNTVGSGGSAPDLDGSFNSLDYNLIRDTTGASLTGATAHNITGQDPLLGAMANNGGPTMTRALLPGSPAINAGSNALAVDANGNALTTDQRGIGFRRISGGTVDIGAFEVQPVNPIDQPDFFVKQHYLDFLNRQPDQSGWDFWTGTILSCGGDLQCVEVKRIHTSAAFFLSIEFQQTGNLVYKVYKAGFGNLPNKPVAVDRAPFMTDTRQIQSTPAQVIVGQPGWDTQLETNKQSFALAFVQRAAFQSAHASQDATTYVNSLFANAGVTPTSSERTTAINAFNNAGGGNAGRAAALRSVAESNSVSTKLFNEAFVLMQYFGYLQRNPYDPPEPTLDYSGYNFWLNKLNSFGGDYIKAEMVKAFIASDEYRHRFGP